MKPPPKLHKRHAPKPVWSAGKAVRSYDLDSDVAVDHRTGAKQSARKVLDGALPLEKRS